MMRITIDTNELARAGTLGIASTDTPVVDAGPAPIEHIMRMMGASVAAGVDDGASAAQRSSALLGMRAPTATESPLNPLRAGAPAIGATIDGGRAVHAATRDVPATDTAEPAPTPRAKAKPRRKG